VKEVSSTGKRSKEMRTGTEAVREPLKIGPLSISYFLAFQDILPLSSFLP
jgi:hypothetical protein